MNNQIEPRKAIPAAPVHPLAALITLVLDNIFGIVEITDPFLLLFTSLTVGTVCTLTATLVQRYMAKEEWGPAIAKGLVMGVIAGVPFQVTGTAAGGVLLAWAGLHKWMKPPYSQDRSSPEEHQIIDIKPK